jgi:hypothetical protein
VLERDDVWLLELIAVLGARSGDVRRGAALDRLCAKLWTRLQLPDRAEAAARRAEAAGG